MTLSGVFIFQLCKSNGGSILAFFVFLMLVITILGWVINSIVTSIFGAICLAITTIIICVYAIINNICLNLFWTQYHDLESTIPPTNAECVKTPTAEQTNSPRCVVIKVDETNPSN
ncbi:unnamed protein product [Hymenolepis diminuta]|uniref:Uncharacterized protein n=1 Tax=Hymenolepis diminuta TaxID=6216 RepID=A0A564YE27_HYMDI|nr:unnamed protein product [Hymenolepis diminuta]